MNYLGQLFRKNDGEDEILHFENLEIYSQEFVDYSSLIHLKEDIIVQERINQWILSILNNRKSNIIQDNGKIEEFEDIKLTKIDFSSNLEDFLNFIQSCIDHKFLRLMFKECKFPIINEDILKKREFTTPIDKQRPFYSIGFDTCHYTTEKE